jgi:hypothetical protein
LSSVYQKAYDKWGEDAQLLKLIEELDELRQAVCDYQHRQFNLPIAQKMGTIFVESLPDPEKLVDHIIEEAVDVSIMVRQLKIIFPKRQPRWKYWLKFKVDRLAERVKGESSKPDCDMAYTGLCNHYLKQPECHYESTHNVKCLKEKS